MKFDELRDSKWFYVLLSIFFATLFWLFVRNTLDPSQDITVRNIPVVLTGENMLEDQGLTVKAISDERVNLNINCPLSISHQLNFNTMSVAVDVSKCSAAENYSLGYTIVYPINVNKDKILVNDRNPSKITVTVDKLNSSTFQIEPRLQGSVAEGYQAGKWSLSQDSVIVSGTAEQVSQIAGVEAVLTGENLTERVSNDVPLVLLDAQGNVLDDLDVKLSVDTVYVTLPIVVLRDIPLTVSLISGGGVNVDNVHDYTVTTHPETITISGEKDDMENLTEISLGSIDLAKVIGVNSFSFPINLDSSLENVSGMSQATVTVTINNLDTATFDVENIDLIQIPEGRAAEKITQMRTIVVRGHEEDLAMLDASQFRIVADLSEQTTTGSIQVPVKVYLNAPSTVGVIGEYNIVVKIS